MQRAYAVLTLKAVDEDQRILEGIASTPEPDRMGDIVESAGAVFKLPLPLLWQHRADQPIGHVLAATVTKSGIKIRAQIAKDILPHIESAWALIKAGLVRGLSIGFRPLESADIDGTWSTRFLKWEWLELSAVTIPANADANITTIKSLDAEALAASGLPASAPARTPAGVSARGVRLASKGAPSMKKSIADQIKDFEATRQAKVDERNGLLDAASEKGETLAQDAAEKHDELDAEIKAIDQHLARLRAREVEQVAQAKAVTGDDAISAAASRSAVQPILVRSTAPPGIDFTRAVLCKADSFLRMQKGEPRSAYDIAKERYPDNARLHLHLKAAVPAGTTTQAVWAGPLVDPTNLASEFIEFLRPQTIIGKFGADGVPALRRVPFNIRVIGQTNGGNAWWVGQGAPKPLTSFAFEATTLTWAKIATIAVITRELARFSSPAAEGLVRDQLAAALRDQLDRDFVDPATAAVTNVSPASITNGLTALSSAGTSADNARTDLQNLLEQFILLNINPVSVVLIMPNTLALALSLMRNSLGQREFPNISMNGGFLEGIPVITSQHAANQSGAGNMVIAVNAQEIFFADDGEVTVEASTEASLEMLDNPTNNSGSATATSMVSMFQTNSLALLAERFINWARRRTGSVAYMDDVNWGSIGSPS